MLNNNKDRKYKIGWKRCLIITLVVSLLIGTYSFSDFGSKAQAAEFDPIKEIVYDSVVRQDYYTGYNTSMTIYLESGKIFSGIAGKTLSSVPIGSTKVRNNTASIPGVSTSTPLSYIDSNGRLYVGDQLIETDVKDYVIGRGTIFSLKKDGTVTSRGKGTSGQLGVGPKADKLVSTEVVKPDSSGDPIEGIKKIFPIGGTPSSGLYDGVLLVGDGEVFLVGLAFGVNSYTGGIPIKLSIFPAFESAEQFDMKFLSGLRTVLETRYTSTTNITTKGDAYIERRVFIIKGKSYSLSNLYQPDVKHESELLFTSLTALPDNFDIENLYITAKSKASDGWMETHTPTIYAYKTAAGDLTSWGTTPSTVAGSSNVFDGTPRAIASGVTEVVPTDKHNITYLRNKRVFAFGPNTDNRTGVAGGVLSSPQPILGPNNELKNIKRLAADSYNSYALTEEGSLITWYSDKTFKTYTRKYIDLISIPIGYGNYILYGISEDYKLYKITGYGLNLETLALSDSIAPKGYVAPVTAPDKPVLAITSQDKFNQSVVSINFGTTGDITTKQYQINGGGWLSYTGDIVVTQSGNVTVQARSADSKGNISEVGELTLTNVPIVITAGHPSIDKVSGDEFKINAVATGNTKVQVKVDGGTWQDFNVSNNLLLTPGAHTVEVRLLNERDQELISKTFNVTADTPTPVVVDKPVVTQKGLNNQYGLDIEITFDAAVGEAQYSIDGGGTWNKTTGSFSVSNAAHTIQAKVVTPDNKESEVTEFRTTIVPPKIIVTNDQVTVDLGINTNNVTVYYKDSSSNQWVEYTGPVTYVPGTHNIEIEVRDRTTGTPVFTGGPYTVTVTGTIPGDGGTTPTPDPGDGTPVGQEDVEFTVNNGGLSARFEGADLSTIVIDSTNPYQSINSVSRALIDDSRGNGKGYQYSMHVTDFQSEPMQDNSTNQKNLVVSIPANAFSVNVQSTKTLNGPAAELSNVGKHVFTGKAPIMLAMAEAFEGMGYNEIPLDFTLSVPDRVGIVTSGSGSKFVPGETTGLMAGTYRAQVVITLTSGI